MTHHRLFIPKPTLVTDLLSAVACFAVMLALTASVTSFVAGPIAAVHWLLGLAIPPVLSGDLVIASYWIHGINSPIALGYTLAFISFRLARTSQKRRR